jgi:hypothetical protein
MMSDAVKSKAVAAALAQISPILSTFETTHGLPQSLWRDHYMVSFFGNLIGLNVSLACEDQLSPSEKGHALAESFSHLSGLDGQALLGQFTRAANDNADEFKLAADRAFILLGYTLQLLQDEDDYADVVAAKAALGPESRRETVAAFLVMEYFVREARKRRLVLR